YREAAAAAVALFVDLEFALAGAKLFAAAPVQRPVLDLQRAVFAVDRFGKTVYLLGLADHVGLQAFAGIDALPATAAHGLAVVSGNGGHDLVWRLRALSPPGLWRL